MAYKLLENGNIEKSETKTMKSQVSVGQLKQECEQIDSEITRLIERKDGLIAELTAINASGVVEVKDVPKATLIK